MRDNPPVFFLTKLCPFFDLEFSKCSYSRALAPACGALVSFLFPLCVCVCGCGMRGGGSVHTNTFVTAHLDIFGV